VLFRSDTLPTFQYVVIYNDSATADNLIAYYDYGSAVNLSAGSTFTITFDGAGILTIA
jgi:hypothetical protein